MFLGEHQHSVDAKGRVILPARFRDQLEGGAVMARALDGCLAVYPVDEFDRLATRIREVRERGGEQRQTARTFFAGAIEIAPDKQGRVAVPPSLREYAGLTKEAMVTGVLTRIEIWDAVRWREHKAAGRSSLHEAGSSGFGI